jgi:hypothetical protein
MGMRGEASSFKRRQDIPFRLLYDTTRSTYKLMKIPLGSWMNVAGPGVWVEGVQSLAKGNKQRMPRQSPKQLGGVAVIASGGDLLYLHRSRTAADNTPADELIDLLPR